MVQDAGAAAIAVHGRTAEQSYSGTADWDLVARIAGDLAIPVFGSGDCIEPEQIVERMRSGVQGVLVGRGVLRNPWILAQATDLAAGRAPRAVTLEDRGQFLLDYIELLLQRTDRRCRAPSRTIAGSSTSFARWDRGTRKASRTVRIFAPRSTAPSRFRKLRDDDRDFLQLPGAAVSAV